VTTTTMITGMSTSVYLPGTPREHTIDPETLRDVPSHPLTLADWVAETRRAPVPVDAVAERRHRTELGTAARLAGDLALAEWELVRAAELAARESPAVALRARIRLANVLHWQGRYDEAGPELDACVADAATPADRAFAHQHAGRCAYDTGDVDRAAAHFQAALRLRVAAGVESSFVEASRTATDAADACRTAIAMAAELDRLVPAAHHRISEVLRADSLLPERPRQFGVLLELRGLLPAGPVATIVMAGLFRYEPKIDSTIAALVGSGWLVRSAGIAHGDRGHHADRGVGQPGRTARQGGRRGARRHRHVGRTGVRRTGHCGHFGRPGTPVVRALQRVAPPPRRRARGGMAGRRTDGHVGG
jgi:hypothetical protein